MARLPQPGGDTGNWGTILNEFLSATHTTDGGFKPGVIQGSHLADGSITTDKLADASITTTKLASSVQSTLSSVVTTSTVGAAGGIASLDSSGKVPASQLPQASGGTTPVATATTSGTIQLSGDLGGSANSPTVAKLRGVSLSGTPSAGQALVATSSTAAGWQTVSTGGATNPNAGTVWNTTSDPASGGTASSVKNGDIWMDGTTDPSKVILEVRVNGQWVAAGETAKPTATTTTAPLASTTQPETTDTSVTLHWTAPSQVAGTLNGYNVYEGSSTTPLNSSLIAAGTTSFTTTTALTPGTNYSFIVKAVSTPTGGSQTESAGLTIQATTTGSVVTPLAAPTGVTATAGDASAVVSFGLVTEATSYTVTSNPGGITKTGTTSPLTVDGLTNDTSYTFTVTATDGTRTSAASAASAAVVPTAAVVTPLAAPTGVSATGGNSLATVSFSLVTEATSYTVTSNPGGITNIGATSPIVVEGLANGTSYTFTVSATDGTRTSAESAPSGAVVPSGGGSLPLNKVAIIGDSLTEQGGSASEIVKQSLKDAGWADAWYYAKGGKEFAAADGNGKTTMQNIDDCRAQFGEPDLWVIALATNDYFRTVNNGRTVNQVKADMQTVLTKLGANAKVAWVNIGFGYEDGGSASLNTSLEADVSARAGTATIDWHQYSRPIVNNMTYWASNADKVHMTSAGYAMRNTYVAQQSVAAFQTLSGS